MELDRYAIGMARLANAIIASVRKDGALSQKPNVFVSLTDGGQKSNGPSSLVHQEDAIQCMRVQL
jgi:hypothetical protein